MTVKKDNFTDAQLYAQIISFFGAMKSVLDLVKKNKFEPFVVAALLENTLGRLEYLESVINKSGCMTVRIAEALEGLSFGIEEKRIALEENRCTNEEVEEFIATTAKEHLYSLARIFD